MDCSAEGGKKDLYLGKYPNIFLLAKVICILITNLICPMPIPKEIIYKIYHQWPVGSHL